MARGASCEGMLWDMLRGMMRVWSHGLVGLLVAGVGCSSRDEPPVDTSSSGGVSSAETGGQAPTSGGSDAGGTPGSGGQASGGANAVGGDPQSGAGGLVGSGGWELGSGGEGPGPSGGAGGGPAGGAGGNDAGTGGASACEIDLDCRPEVLPSSGDFAQDCVDRINQFRVGCFCLSPLERWTEAEECAEANAEFDKAADSPHAGWGSDGVCSEDDGPLSKMHNGGATNECPGYSSTESVISTCLLQMYQEGADWAEQLGRAPQQADYESCDLEDCYRHYGHFIAMTNTSYTKVACGTTGAPQVWSVQNFR